MKNSTKKLLLLFTIAVITTMFALSVNALQYDSYYEEGVSDLALTFDEKEGVAIIEGTGELKAIDIPEFAETLIINDGITSIGDNALEFNQCKKIILPTTLTKIGKNAFLGSLFLEEIDIPDSVIEIGRFAFSGCAQLTNVRLSENVIKIEDGTFVCCTFLKEIIIPKSVKSIGIGAFYGCISLESLIIPETVKNIGAFAMVDCLSLKNVYVYNKNLIATNHYSAGDYIYGYKTVTLKEGKSLDELLAFLKEKNKDFPIHNLSNISAILIFSDEPACLALLEELYTYITVYVNIFEDFDFEKKHDKLMLMDDTLIHCYRESTAKDYAVANNIDYVCFDHLYDETVLIEATCTEKGSMSYLCECGDSYIGEIATKEHNINNWTSNNNATHIGQCTNSNCKYAEIFNCTFTQWQETENSQVRTCTVCKYKETKNIADNGDNDFEGTEKEDPSDNCSCNCHKCGLVVFFFKIINFFQKLFGKNKICACGVKH